MGKFAVSIEHSEAKSVSASGGLRPPNPRPGALPLDPAGGSAPDPRYRLALCQILNTPLSMKYQKNDVYLSCYHVQMICVYFADLDVINHDEDMEEIG